VVAAASSRSLRLRKRQEAWSAYLLPHMPRTPQEARTGGARPQLRRKSGASWNSGGQKPAFFFRAAPDFRAISGQGLLDPQQAASRAMHRPELTIKIPTGHGRTAGIHRIPAVDERRGSSYGWASMPSVLPAVPSIAATFSLDSEPPSVLDEMSLLSERPVVSLEVKPRGSRMGRA
jgi:hypothetical protein